MARIRTIKPEFWSSPDIGDVSRDARLTFVGLWNIADDTGRLEAVPAQIRSVLFPYDDDVTVADVCGWLNELAIQGLIRLFSQGRRAYLSIVSWADHQKISNPSQPRCPDPDDCRTLDAITPTIQRDLACQPTLRTPSLARPSVDPTETLGRPSAPELRNVGPSERRNVGPSEDPPSPPSGSRTRGCRLPDGWTPDPEPDLVTAFGGPDAARAELDRFADYWRAQPGAKGRKADWQATWRNWLRRAAEDRKPVNGRARGSPVEAVSEFTTTRRIQ
jgi:hypothetical protein